MYIRGWVGTPGWIDSALRTGGGGGGAAGVGGVGDGGLASAGNLSRLPEGKAEPGQTTEFAAVLM